MTVDYDEWDNAEKRATGERLGEIFEELAKGKQVRLTSLFPEFKLRAEETFTVWAPASDVETKLRDPTTNLGNLVTLYNRILIPIHVHSSKQDFASKNSISLEDLTQLLKENPTNYIPMAMGNPDAYRRAGFYDDILQACQSQYGHYPVGVLERSRKLQQLLFLAAKTAIDGNAIPVEEQMQRFPEIEPSWVRENEVDPIAHSDIEGLRTLSKYYGTTVLDVKLFVSMMIASLRASGHEDLVKFLLENFGGKLVVLWEILDGYTKFLVEPTNLYIGGFGNFTAKDLEKMAFLRIMPLVAKDVKDLDKENLRLLFNSPGARSSVNLESYKMRVFLKGGDDVNTLNELVGFAERHKKETRAMSEYKESVARGKLSDASEALRKSGEIYGQISEEVEELAKKEKAVKLATYALTGGATLFGNAALILQQGLPPEWRLVITMFKDALRLKNLDPKRIVELIYDIRQWPWYEKGIPYLYWKAS